MKTRNALQKFMAIALEAEADGQTRPEKEIVTYGKITDFKELEKADRKEEQEQWEVRSKTEGNIYQGTTRIRCVDKKQYLLTTKTFQPDKGDLLETEVELDPEVGKNFLEQFKKLSTGGMVKTRYFFPVPDSELTWEVDVYYDEDGQAREWCKIDLEVPSFNTKRPELPITLAEAQEISAKNRTEAQQRFVERLMAEEFVTPNPYQKHE